MNYKKELLALICLIEDQSALEYLFYFIVNHIIV